MTLAELRPKLLYGIPPLTDDECRFLWQQATGETIHRRRRCLQCEGAGVLVTRDDPKEEFSCPYCQGEGYYND